MVVDCVLRDAATRGDEETVCRLVRNGEDANAVIGALILGAASLDELDASRAQKTAPGRLAILSFLLENHFLSLYTLNASHSSLKGLTPLGMVAYLNRLDFVTVLLEKGEGIVLVDGVDSQRATPIMYAARDGHIEVLQYLIRQGARINTVDCFHHSVLFYSVSVHECLWVCELHLRLQRAQSLLSQSRKRKLKLTLKYDVGQYNALACLYQQRYTTCPSSSKDGARLNRLVESINSSDLSAVNSFLHPILDYGNPTSPGPTFVNLPDENGWSPIHYCVTSSRPSTAVLDALFLAGADITLYTADNSMTPLHALARFGGATEGTSFRLYSFIVHLVRDLGAPLDAVDVRGETCIHVAARYGRCADVLMALLECDDNGTAAKIRNNEGQTAYDVAKPEFRSIFEQDDGSMRPDSAASLRTIKPSFSSSSLASNVSSGSSDSSSSLTNDLAEQHEQFPRAMSREKEKLRAALTNTAEAQQLLDDLEYVSEQLRQSQVQAYNPVELEDVEDLLQHTSQNGQELLECFRQLIDAEVDDLHAAQGVHSGLEQLIERLEQCALAEEEEGARTPRTASPDRRISAVPSLVASGGSSLYSSASLTSLADLAALRTPTGSPRQSSESLKTLKAATMQGRPVDEEIDLDFACALAAGSVTRRRRASALGAIFTVGGPSASFSEPYSPLEEGINLISIPPIRAPDVQQEGGVQVRSSPGIRVVHESWLDPYVRRANSDMLKAHLANLLEIEQMLFGKEDREREEAPSPGLVKDEAEDVPWREGVDAFEEEDGNFLEMFDADEEGEGEGGGGVGDDDQFLDLFDHAEGDVVSPAKDALRPMKIRCSAEPSVMVVDVLRIAKRELSAVEESIITACRSIETAQHYISRAERLTTDIFREMDDAVQATRLTVALNDLSSAGGESFSLRIPTRSSTPESVRNLSVPVSSPISQRMNSFAFPLPPPSSCRLQGRASMQSFVSVASPVQTPITSGVTKDDLRALRRLLVRKVPIWLDATAYDVDKASTWVGIAQAVVHSHTAQRTRF